MKHKAKFKVGLVGCGNMAKVHIRLLSQFINKDDIAVFDKDEMRLKDFIKSMGLLHAYHDFDKLLALFRPDVIHVVTPPATHKDIAVKCLESKIHVLIEKPLCVTSDEADAIMLASQKFGRKVCVDHMRSFDPMIEKVKRMLDSGSYGDITHVSIGYSSDYLIRHGSDAAGRWMHDLPGGYFFDRLPHLLCLLDDFLPDLKVKSTYIKKDAYDVVTDLACSFTSTKGLADLHMSLNVFPLKNYIEFECTKGVIRVDLRNFLIIVRKCYGLPNSVERIVQNISVGSQILFGSINSIFQFILGNLDSYAGLGNIIKKYYEAIEQNKESPVPAQRAKKLLEMTEEIFAENYLEEDIKNPLKGLLAKKPEVLVTGGTGLIGRRLVNRLVKEGHKVRVFSHRKLSQKERDDLYTGDVEILRGDIYKVEDVREACKGIKTVYHLAAAMKGDWNYHMDTTITGTQNVLTAAEEAKVKHLIYVSTLNVYDAKKYPQNKEINESFPYEDQPHNRGNYSNAKLQAEKIVREFMLQTSMTISIIRPGLVYGPGFKPLPGDAGLRLGRNFVVVFGMGFRKLPLVYVDNLVDALILMQEKIIETGEIFHLVDEERISQRQYIKSYKKIAKESFMTVYVPLWFVSLGFMTIEGLVRLLMGKKVSLNYKLRCVSKSPIFSSASIQKKLDWQQNINFPAGLTRTIHGDAG